MVSNAEAGNQIAEVTKWRWYLSHLPSGEWSYPRSGVKLRPSERRYKPYIVVLLVRYRLDNFPADLLFVI
jgi:hypothetical protein